MLLTAYGVGAAELTYRIVAYNADAQAFTLEASGQRPTGSVAYFENDYGATTGNRYNQIPRNRQATLYLYGWDGCRVNSVTLSMCSNNKAGTCGLTVAVGETPIMEQKPVAFADPTWYGEWVSKDLGIYVDVAKPIEKPMTIPDDNELTITIKGGTPEGSVYINAITIDYDPSPIYGTESPLGYVYEKMEAKSTLGEGDVVMLYRSGDAAGDIDGMATSHYLDAIGLSSTSNVVEPDVEYFTLMRDETNAHWYMTDQYGRRLGAVKAQQLAWDEGVTTWDITLGYSGATIASTNSKYGTLRYNAPSGSWPRFWNYTSTSLALPYIYRRVRQLEPVQTTSVLFATEVRSVELGSQDTLVLRTSILPAKSTDRRLRWSSTDEQVATVRDGIVHPLAVGQTAITAETLDGGASATMTLVVTAADGIERPMAVGEASARRYDLQGRPVGKRTRGVVVRGGRKVLIR